MNNFDVKRTTIMAELNTRRFDNLCRQEQMSEKILHLEKRVMEQLAEEMGVAETFNFPRAKPKERMGTRLRVLFPCFANVSTFLLIFFNQKSFCSSESLLISG